MPPREHYGLAALSTSGGQLTMPHLGQGAPSAPLSGRSKDHETAA
jgi:hypothetical protein